MNVKLSLRYGQTVLTFRNAIFKVTTERDAASVLWLNSIPDAAVMSLTQKGHGLGTRASGEEGSASLQQVL